ncbi:MAG: DNA recombination protein RmuC [Gammaproteobacteria bacterium]|nr:DNA recombination protein RmuC [Gammaproteobacteria bacterium]
MTGWLWSLAGIGAGGLIGAFVALIVSIRRQRFERAELLGVVETLRETQRELSESYQVASTSAARLEAENGQLAEQLEAARDEAGFLREDGAEANLRLTQVATRLQEAEKAFAEKQAMFKDTSEALKSEFQLLANRIFEKQGETFRQRNEQQLQNVLSPFREQIRDFKQRVEQVYVTESKDRASLLTEVQNLQKASERVNAEAQSLTRALRGDKRIQGNWGEMVLERVLEESGLRKDHEYVVQTSFRSADGDLKRPDVVIHLPGDKDVVIDSKVSLGSYERALGAVDEPTREAALKEHVANLRNHVKRLSQQNYDRLDGVRSLDFVLLFVPIEAAFMLGMERDPGLFTEAFDKRLVIVSPTTLMMTLRIIQNVWRFEKQSKNAQEIAQRAGALYDKLRRLLEDMEQLGRNLSAATRTYDSAYAKLATQRGNLVRQVEHFRELGANVKRRISKQAVDQADD